MMPGRAAGTWRWTLPVKGGRAKHVLRLRQRFQDVTGTLEVDGQAVPIADAKLVGDGLSFNLVREAAGQKATTAFNGRIVGDTLVGSVENPGGPEAEKQAWKAKRDRISLAGTWRWTQGDKPHAVRIQSYDGRYYGSLAGKGRQSPVRHLYVWGAGVYFTIKDGKKQTYEGVVEGDRIVGTVTADGPPTEWTAQRGKK
jgi:hypothetical protein